jgi:hypothetical protein
MLTGKVVGRSYSEGRAISQIALKIEAIGTIKPILIIVAADNTYYKELEKNCKTNDYVCFSRVHLGSSYGMENIPRIWHNAYIKWSNTRFMPMNLINFTAYIKLDNHKNVIVSCFPDAYSTEPNGTPTRSSHRLKVALPIRVLPYPLERDTRVSVLGRISEFNSCADGTCETTVIGDIHLKEIPS